VKSSLDATHKCRISQNHLCLIVAACFYMVGDLFSCCSSKRRIAANQKRSTHGYSPDIRFSPAEFIVCGSYPCTATIVELREKARACAMCSESIGVYTMVPHV
jgi:hypothetical protein